MLSFSRAMNSVLVVTLLSALSVAQTIQPSSSKSEKASTEKSLAEHDAKRALTLQQEQAVLVLKTLSGRAKNFANNKAGIETQAQIADTLWEYDQQTARRQFTEAFQSIDRIEDDESPTLASHSPKTSLRSALLRLITKRDAKLAEKLINSVSEKTAKSDSDSITPTTNRDDQGKLLLSSAQQLLSTDPQRATALIQRSFSSGLSIELVTTLKFLHRKDAKVADNLLRQALSEISPNSEAPLMDLFILWSYFGPDDEKSVRAEGRQQPENSESPFDWLKPELVEPLLNFAFKAISIESAKKQREASDPPRERMFMFDLLDQGNVAALLPLFEKYQPQRAAFVRGTLDQIERDIPTRVLEKMAAPEPVTVKGLLDKAQNEKNAFLKDFIYADAARQAAEEGDFDQAIAIAGKISDKSAGMGASYYRSQAANDALGKGNLDVAYQYAKQLPDAIERARLLYQIARKAVEKSDQQRFNELIDEAEKLIAMSDSKSKKVYALLDIAATITPIDSARGYKVVNAAVEAINQGYSTASDRVDWVLEWAIFDESLGRLARDNFQTSLRLARSITHDEISVLAQLAVCRGVLVESKESRRHR